MIKMYTAERKLPNIQTNHSLKSGVLGDFVTYLEQNNIENRKSQQYFNILTNN